MHILIMSRLILIRIRNVSDKPSRENQNTHIVFNTFYQKSCRLRDNVEKCCRAVQDTDDHILRRINSTHWLTKATDTHSEYQIRFASPQQQ
jgi:hypothetical protein